MILTCPECATSYFVDDSRIPSQGRKVRCTSCGHRWMAGPDGPIADEIAAEPPPEPPVEAVAEPEPAPALAPEDDCDVVVEEPAPRPIRRTPPPPSRRTEGRGGVLVWAGAAALAAALIAGVIVFREQVIRLWPRTSAAYAGLGFPVGGDGLVLEKVKVEPAFLAGRPMLSVTGAIRNVRDEPVSSPPVRVTLLNRAGKPVAAKIARPLDATIPARAERHFAIAILDPPATARDLEVRFERGAGGGEPLREAQAVVSAAPAAAPSAPPAAPAASTTPPEPAAPAEPAAPPEAPLSPAAATEHG